MLPAREAAIDKAHREVMLDNSIESLTKGIFYALLMNADVGVGDILTIPAHRVAAIDLWFGVPSRTAKAEDLLKRVGVVVIQPEFET